MTWGLGWGGGRDQFLPEGKLQIRRISKQGIRKWRHSLKRERMAFKQETRSGRDAK